MFNKRGRSGEQPGGVENPRAPWLVAIELNRLLAVMLVFSFGLIAFLVVWHQMNPVTKEVPVYIEFQTGANNFVVLHRAGGDLDSLAGQIAREARRYVALREPIDKASEGERYPQVMLLSSDKVKQAFKTQYGGKDGLYLREGFKREVRILRDARLAEGVHQVEFQTRDWTEGITHQDKAPWVSWVATMAYKFDTQKIRRDDVVINPLGWQTMEYTVTKRSE
jgi:type IV secretory pathway component VirB8